MIENKKEEESIDSRLRALESELEMYRKDAKDKKSFYSFVSSCAGRLFCRQNLELGLSISALAISLAVAMYIFKI